MAVRRRKRVTKTTGTTGSAERAGAEGTMDSPALNAKKRRGCEWDPCLWFRHFIYAPP